MTVAATPTDRLFAGLDGRALRVDGHEWRVQVFGVIDDAGRRWVELALDGDRPRVLTLVLTASEGPHQAVRRLSSWLANPADDTNDVQLHVA